MRSDHSYGAGVSRSFRFPQLLLALFFILSVRPVLAAELNYSYGGDADWFSQSATSHDGGEAHQSGAISHSESSWMETTVTGPGAIRFWWKVSSEYCCDLLRFSMDGSLQSYIRGEGEWQSQAFAVPAGSHTLRWTYSTDGSVLGGSNAGWLDEISFTPGTGFDFAAPVTNATPATGTYAPSQSVTLSCTDNVACSGTWYCLGSSCTPATPYSGPITVSSTTDLRFYSTDAAGNDEAVKTEQFYIDTAPPTTYATPGAGTYSGTRDVGLYCYDYALGCASTYYCLGSGCTPSTPYSTPIAIATSTELRFYSVDQGGAREPVNSLSFTITPDVSPPTTMTTLDSGTYSPTSLWFYCSDDGGSGCATTYYCLGTGCTPTTPVTGHLAVDASTEIRFFSEDLSGNREAVRTRSYIIDATPPTTTPSVAGGIYEIPQQVTLSCNDQGGSGCSTTYYCQGKDCNPTQEYTGSISLTASTWLRYYSSDQVSHQEDVKTERYTIPAADRSTINVPSDQATIQGAIDAAVDGDTVMVAPGTYRENIDFKGKVITLQSNGGPDATIIDGQGISSAVSFTSSEWQTTVLNGFTITNGGATNGGAGGGIYIDRASPTIINNKIIANRGCQGAGINAKGGSPIIRNNTISNNSSGGCGGNFANGAIRISDGGWSDPSGAQIIGNTIANNAMSNSYGGGIHLRGSGNIVVRGNIVRSNGGSGVKGGGLYLGSSEAEIVQNLIAGNNAEEGGGVYLSYGAVLANNTIADNDAAQGSGIFFDYWVEGGIIVNNVIAAKKGQPALWNGTFARIRNNVLFATGDVFGGPYSDQHAIIGNINSDPELSGVALGYYGLRPGSPAIDAGDNDGVALPSSDLSGAPRLIDGTGLGAPRVDIGAYEFDPEEPRAQLSNAPDGATQSTSATITVGGAGIVSYRYALDGGAFSSADTPVEVPITLTGLSGGPHAVAVIGKSASREQRPSSATVSQWAIDTMPPVTTATPGGGSYSESQSVTLACDDQAGSGCAGTFYCLGGECTPDTPYSGPIAVTTPTGLSYYSRDAFGNQEPVQRAGYNFLATISGRVSDSVSGTGIPYAIIEVFSATTGSSLSYTHTDYSGAYRIEGIPGGKVKLRFRAAEYVEQWYNGMGDRVTAATVTVSAPGTTGIDAALVRGGSITGTVTGKETGAGVGDVFVTAYSAATGSPTAISATDASGGYSISGLAPGSYKLHFQPQHNSGYLSQWYGNKEDLSSATPVTVAGPATTSGIDAALQMGGTLTGTVTDSATGAPTAGIRVELFQAGTGELLFDNAFTDASGAYRLIGLSGSYKLRFSGNGYLPRWYGGNTDQASAGTVTVTPTSSPTGINAALTRGGSITGLVTDASGVALPYALVQAYDEGGSWLTSAHTDLSGAYRITGLATGSYKLRFTTSGYAERWSGGGSDRAGAATVAVTAPNTTTGTDMVLLRGGTITGRVTDRATGAGIPGVAVVLMKASSSAWVASGYTDSSGDYSITGLSNGGYKVRFSNSEYLERWSGNKERAREAEIVQVSAPDTATGVDVAMVKGGVIDGTVSDRASGQPLPHVQVAVVRVNSGENVDYAVTDGSGKYRSVGLPSGDYSVRFMAFGYAPRWFDGKSNASSATAVTVTAPETSSGVDAALDRGGSVSGTIYDRSTGVGIANSQLTLLDPMTGDFVGYAYSNASGVYTISDLPSGSYRLKIDPPAESGYLWRWYGSQPDPSCADNVTVTAPDRTTGINAGLDLGGSISGRASDAATSAGIPRLQIYLTDTGSHMGLAPVPVVDSSGAYILGPIPSGEYTVTFSAPYYLRTTSQVTVAAPEAVTGLDVSLARGGGIEGRVTGSTGIGMGSIEVLAVEAGSRARAGSAVSDSAGNFLITGLPSGEYALLYDDSYVGQGYGYQGGYHGGYQGAFTGSTSTLSWSSAEFISSGLSAGVISPGLLAGSASVQGGSVTLSNDFDPAIISQSLGSPVAQRSLPASAGPVLPAPAPTAQISSRALPRGPVPGATRISVVAPEISTGHDFTIEPSGAISGWVSESATNAPLRSIRATAYDSITGDVAGYASTDSDGNYTIRGLPSGSYRIEFSNIAGRDPGYLGAWYRSASAYTVSSEVAVLAPETSFGIDARLAKAGGISGTISVSSCPGPTQVQIRAYDASTGELAGKTWLGPLSQAFTIGALPAGSYKLAIASDREAFVRQWYPNKSDSASAEPVAVSAGAITGGIQVSLAAGGGSISGRITGDSGCSFPSGAELRLYDWYSDGLVAETSAAPDGSYRFNGLPDASYKLQFHLNGSDRWYRTEGESAQASRLVLAGGAALTDVELIGTCEPDGTMYGSGANPTLLDVLRALRVAVGLEPAATDMFTHYDLAPMVNGVSEPDGVIGVADALLILRKVVTAPAALAPN